MGTPSSAVNTLKQLASTEAVAHSSIANSLEAEVDKVMASVNAISGRTFGEVDSFFDKLESHLSSDIKVGIEEAKRIVAEFKAKF